MVTMGVLIIVFIRLPISLGIVDFRPYWSASYLFVRGKDFSDLEALDKIQRSLTGWDQSYTMQAWFTPVEHLILSPLTFVPFEQAAKLWLLSNIIVLSLSVWFLRTSTSLNRWLELLVTFSFSATLTSLFFGQVNTLSLLGLALYFF